MKQSRLASLAETSLNTMLGFGISLAAQWFCLPLLGVGITFKQNLLFAVIMTFVSIARGFVLRRLFEALHIRTPISPAMQAIIAERARQRSVEGWNDAHDNDHSSGSLAQAAAAYAIGADFVAAYDVDSDQEYLINGRELWPWGVDYWKPREQRRNWVRAGALLVAEIERDDRARRRRK